MLPTYGRVSRYGLIAFASSLDRVGPFAANVRDAATMLGVIAGHDPKDATSSPAPVPDYAAESDKPAEGLRIGVPAEYFAEGLDAEVRAAIERGIAALEGGRMHGEAGFAAAYASTPSRPITWWPRRRPAPTWRVLTACAMAIARRRPRRWRRCTATRATRVLAPR